MKKIKWPLIAAVLIGGLSAFTAPLAEGNYGKLDDNTFIKVDPDLRGSSGSGGWTCIETDNDTCLFLLETGADPGNADPFGTQYSRSEVAGQDPSEPLDRQFILNP